MQNQNQKQVDILLINPPSPDNSIIIRDFNRSGRTSKERIVWPQISLAYLAAMVPENLTVEIIDCIAENIKWPELTDILKKKKPRYLASQVITSTLHNDLKIFQEIKKINPKTITMTMGPHATALTEKTLLENSELDFIFTYEPEKTFAELITNIENSKNNFQSIKGLAYKENDEVIMNEKRDYIINLDELPIPRHDLLPLKKYVFPFMASSFTFVVPSRGCPFPCTFCRQPVMWAKKFRSRSVESILKELKFIKNLGINEFIFQSDTFTVDKNIVIDLCKKMIDEKLNFKWSTNSRVDTVDEEMLAWMKKAGCWMIAFGIESGSQKVLDKAKKGITLEQIRTTINLTDKIGIKIYGYFIIGLIKETKETIRETINLAKELPITFAIFHTAAPYPGTEFYEEVKKNGWLTSEKWEDINQGTTAPINYPNLSSKEINKGIKKAYRKFYFRPKAVIRILKSLKNIRDINGIIKAAINQLF
ncbi:MAG TPA: radical SAM protein [Candidatus Portnoybacteria bacterium]|mgnify:CR=1 FL=1|nr:radical SAM protein [Candidatus Portnoybacteria bacterium]MDD5752065.1 radical SAM protein [Candidatus Portnoybacteria bacterium]HOZ16415.1 radical SAM protein [Candidatus Portnoybacteria bacterium]HPH52034.1 radical SAM protein [Candidatus Portnoybacteria bacterium]HPJ80184.1 radical SAM protein [Candidatus Portnoybacteria bacterium]